MLQFYIYRIDDVEKDDTRGYIVYFSVPERYTSYTVMSDSISHPPAQSVFVPDKRPETIARAVRNHPKYIKYQEIERIQREVQALLEGIE